MSIDESLLDVAPRGGERFGDDDDTEGGVVVSDDGGDGWEGAVNHANSPQHG